MKKKNYVLKCLVHIPSPSTTGVTWCLKVAEDARVRASTNKIGRHDFIFSDSHDAIIYIHRSSQLSWMFLWCHRKWRLDQGVRTRSTAVAIFNNNSDLGRVHFVAKQPESLRFWLLCFLKNNLHRVQFEVRNGRFWNSDAQAFYKRMGTGTRLI